MQSINTATSTTYPLHVSPTHVVVSERVPQGRDLVSVALQALADDGLNLQRCHTVRVLRYQLAQLVPQLKSQRPFDRPSPSHTRWTSGGGGGQRKASAGTPHPTMSTIIVIIRPLFHHHRVDGCDCACAHVH